MKHVEETRYGLPLCIIYRNLLAQPTPRDRWLANSFKVTSGNSNWYLVKKSMKL